MTVSMPTTLERLSEAMNSHDAERMSRLFTEDFPTATGRARFHAIDHQPPAEVPDQKFPLFLTTGRVFRKSRLDCPATKGNSAAFTTTPKV